MADMSKLTRRTLPTPRLMRRVRPAGTGTASATHPGGHMRTDGRSLRRSNGTVQFATRVTPEFDDRIPVIAERDGLLLVEVMERAHEAYEAAR